jgi:hypothetical protein
MVESSVEGGDVEGDREGRPIGINLRTAEVKKGESGGKMLE